jgi:hypothetical protein
MYLNDPQLYPGDIGVNMGRVGKGKAAKGTAKNKKFKRKFNKTMVKRSRAGKPTKLPKY